MMWLPAEIRIPDLVLQWRKGRRLIVLCCHKWYFVANILGTRWLRKHVRCLILSRAKVKVASGISIGVMIVELILNIYPKCNHSNELIITLVWQHLDSKAGLQKIWKGCRSFSQVNTIFLPKHGSYHKTMNNSMVNLPRRGIKHTLWNQ